MKEIIASFDEISAVFSELITELGNGEWFQIIVFPFALAWALLGVAWAAIGVAAYWVKFFLLAILALPAMFIMAKWYTTWEKWIKENKEITSHLERMVLIIPFSIMIFIAMILYGLFHTPFDEMVKGKYGRKPF